MNMLVSPANQALMFTNSTTGWPIKMVMPNLQAGVGMNLNVLDETLPVASRSIFPKKLVLEKLRLANGALLTTTATQNTYAADIYVQFSQLNGIQLKERNIGTVIITSDIATGAVVTCNSISDVTIQSTCAQMGCTYIPANPEPFSAFDLRLSAQLRDISPLHSVPKGFLTVAKWVAMFVRLVNF
jgi:hypothetical protein